MASTYLFNQYYTIRFLFFHVLTGYMIINSSSSLILDYVSIYHSKQSVTRQRYFPLVLTYRLNNICPCFMNMYSEAQGETEDYEYSKAVPFRELYIYTYTIKFCQIFLGRIIATYFNLIVSKISHFLTQFPVTIISHVDSLYTNSSIEFYTFIYFIH